MSVSSIHLAESEESYMECFVGLVLAIVLSSHSLNLVQRFSYSGENKLLACFCKTVFYRFHS
jgi:hypothetical protein